jgi:RNA polymerase sigma-70 factor (ECF subfamily)
MPTSSELHQLANALHAARLDPGREALGQLLDGCRAYLLHIARMEWPAALRPKESPSDLVQQTLAEAYQDFHRFAGDSQEEWLAWVRRLLLNNLQNLIKHYHTDKRDVSKEAIGIGDSSAAPLDQLIAPDPTPCTQAQREERTILLDRAMAALPEDYRQVIRLRHEQNLPFAEVGRRLGCSEEAARKLWGRAVKQLARRLGVTP